jgi:hypothetical protein
MHLGQPIRDRIGDLIYKEITHRVIHGSAFVPSLSRLSSAQTCTSPICRMMRRSGSPARAALVT